MTLKYWLSGLGSASLLLLTGSAQALPPAEDIPEEVMRNEIILEARSPLNGEPLTLAEYAELQAELAERIESPTPRSDLRQAIFLLQLRRAARTLLPFVPIP